MRRLTKAHTGEYLAKELASCLREFGIDLKVSSLCLALRVIDLISPCHAQLMGLTADNAENNSTLIRELQKIIPSWPGKSMRVRCFGHILNLVVKVCPSFLSHCCRILA